MGVNIIMSTTQKLDKQNVEDILALTPVQEGMLFHYLNQPSSELYFEQLSFRLVGKINMEILKKPGIMLLKQMKC